MPFFSGLVRVDFARVCWGIKCNGIASGGIWDDVGLTATSGPIVLKPGKNTTNPVL